MKLLFKIYHSKTL